LNWLPFHVSDAIQLKMIAQEFQTAASFGVISTIGRSYTRITQGIPCFRKGVSLSRSTSTNRRLFVKRFLSGIPAQGHSPVPDWIDSREG
jgi:hypothetical protein